MQLQSKWVSFCVCEPGDLLLSVIHSTFCCSGKKNTNVFFFLPLGANNY